MSYKPLAMIACTLANLCLALVWADALGGKYAVALVISGAAGMWCMLSVFYFLLQEGGKQ